MLLTVVLLLVVCLCGCNVNFSKDIITTTVQQDETILFSQQSQPSTTLTTQQQSTQSESTESSATDVTTTTEPSTKEATLENSELLPLPKDNILLSFSSGYGSWKTTIALNRDGTFVGRYFDSNASSTGEKYPNGSIYICNFEGEFEYVEKLNDYSYRMVLTQLESQQPEGKEWIKNKTRYIASEPYGLNVPSNHQGEKEFILYLPEAPVDELLDAFLSWRPAEAVKNNENEENSTLSCYGLLNVSKDYGFFYVEPQEKTQAETNTEVNTNKKSPKHDKTKA
jgi:hypothetical protein